MFRRPGGIQTMSSTTVPSNWSHVSSGTSTVSAFSASMLNSNFWIALPSTCRPPRPNTTARQFCSMQQALMFMQTATASQNAEKRASTNIHRVTHVVLYIFASPKGKEQLLTNPFLTPGMTDLGVAAHLKSMMSVLLSIVNLYL